MLLALTLAVGLGGIVATVDNQILWSVVMLAAEVGLEDVLRARSVSDLSIDGGTRHVRNGGVAAAPWVLGVAEWVVLWCWLWEPDVTTVPTELSALECLGDILLDDNGATGGIDEPCTCFC